MGYWECSYMDVIFSTVLALLISNLRIKSLGGISQPQTEKRLVFSCLFSYCQN